MKKEKIEQHFEAAQKERGMEYVGHRDKLVSQGDSILSFIKNKQKSKEFETKMLAQIIKLWLEDRKTCEFIHRVAIGQEPTLNPDDYVTGAPPIKESAEVISSKGEDWLPITSEIAWKDIEKRTNYAFSVVCEVFLKWRSNDAFTVLEGELRNDENEDFIRIKSMDTMVRLDPDTTYPIISEIFDDEEERLEVRNSSLYNMTLVDKPESLEKIKEVLFDEDQEIKFRCTSATALGDLGDHENTSTLVEAYDKTDNNALKKSIIDSLAILGDKSVIPKLKDINSSDEDETLKKAASNSLEMLR